MKPSRSFTIVAAGVALCAGGAALAQSSATEGRIREANADAAVARAQLPDTNASQAFVSLAAQSDMTEIQASQLARSKSQDTRVREFAQHMITDHGKASTELKDLAQKRSLMVPASLDAEHKAVIDKLSGMSGAAFDRAYKQQMVMDHDKAVALFTEATGKVNADLSEFASTTLPTLQEHQRMAKEMVSKRQASAAGSRDSGSEHADHESHEDETSEK